MKKFLLVIPGLFLFTAVWGQGLNSAVSAAVEKPNFYQLENYVIPESSKVVLTEQDVYELSPYKLNYARNEIYARHGYIFKDADYSAYFSEKSWYKKNPAFNESLLSGVEKKNLQFLKAYSDKLKANFKKVEGMKTTLDLNGDGKKDTVTLKSTAGGDSYTLTVNKSSVSGTGDNLDGVMYICDLDSKDKYKEIAITESGPSDDYSTYFYSYNGRKLIYMGRVQGAEHVIKVNGSGKLVTKTRGDILQTWFYSDEYSLSASRKLVHIPRTYYKMNTIVTVKKQLKLQKSPTNSGTAAILKGGEKAVITETDNQKWCAVVTKDGVKGWVAVSGFSRINGIEASEYFDGLSYAD
ncbi:hypothetical protein PSTEL_20020 [Paenibacillus stellifer]|uniref:YARHG domain-containing protein n=1 Tax=Paenibacillus stellifer TaxID=169760 RepID=A0A089LY46_9BACL|nr:hypothetical protein PSTEL_20020 [Paenibacillus stellifer]